MSPPYVPATRKPNQTNQLKGKGSDFAATAFSSVGFFEIFFHPCKCKLRSSIPVKHEPRSQLNPAECGRKRPQNAHGYLLIELVACRTNFHCQRAPATALRYVSRVPCAPRHALRYALRQFSCAKSSYDRPGTTIANLSRSRPRLREKSRVS